MRCVYLREGDLDGQRRPRNISALPDSTWNVAIIKPLVSPPAVILVNRPPRLNALEGVFYEREGVDVREGLAT